MPSFVRVAGVSDVPDRGGLCVEVNDKRIGLFRIGDEIFAIDDTCTHAEASLSEGDVAGDEVICPLHSATFDLRTGRCTGPPAFEDVATYPVRVVGDDVEVQV